jgi:hypothetical protein
MRVSWTCLTSSTESFDSFLSFAAIVQKAIAWYILSNPDVHAKLKDELGAGSLSFSAQHQQTKGLTLPDGRFIASGTKVGISAWVSSRDETVCAADRLR